MQYRTVSRALLPALLLFTVSSCSSLKPSTLLTAAPASNDAKTADAPSSPGYADNAPAPLLIPHPKLITYKKPGSRFAFTANTRIVIADQADAEEHYAARLLRREIETRFRLRLPVANASSIAKLPIGRDNLIVLAGPAFPSFVAQQLRPAGSLLAVPQKPEGYALSIDPGLVLVTGRDAHGLMWGVQTLLQLASAAAKGAPPEAPSVAIRDWPTLSLRAVHLFHGRNALPFHKKLIERIFSRYKLNALFIEAEQVRWNQDPKVAPDWAGNRAQLKEEIAFARERGVTVYPLIQSYGHMGWLLDNDRNRGLAEDPLIPYALNYSDPKAVARIDGFNAEADDLFAAPGFHVGLDEVTLRGRFPYRSRPKTFPQMYVQAATHWDNFYRKRGKPVFMWADQALSAIEENPDFGTAPSAAEAKAVREGLPKDIIMMDWQYGERTEFPSLRRLKEAGFKNVVAATWYRPQNIQNFARVANEVGALGAIQTTWAGYNSEESILNSEDRKQFTAMVLAAEYFWNGGEGPAPDKLPYDPKKVFAAQWRSAAAP